MQYPLSGLCSISHSTAGGKRPIFSDIRSLAMEMDTGPLSSSRSPSIMAGDFIVEVICPVMQC